MFKKKEMTIKKKKAIHDKKNNLRNFLINNKHKSIMILSILFICIIAIIILLTFNKNKVVITIDNINYTEKDFNMYAYLVKYDYFGIDGTELSKNTLKTQVSNDSSQTIADFLKEKTISKIKVSAAIQRIASENNIELSKEDIEEIEGEKQKFIEQLGGKNSFKSTLKKNGTNELSFIEAVKIEKLYDKVLNSLYGDGKRYDLTEEDLVNYKSDYYDDYVKIKQIILLKKDLDTNKYYDDVTLNQKEVLAKELSKMAKNGRDFDDLIKKYSELSNGEAESEYYLKSELNKELQTAINSLTEGDTSDVISSDYAYHIIIIEKLDDSKLSDYYDTKRELKLVDDITENLEKIAIINNDYLEEITVK